MFYDPTLFSSNKKSNKKDLNSPVNLTPNGWVNWVLQLHIKEFEFVLPILLNVLQNVELAYFLTRAIQVNLTVHIKQPCNTLRGLSNKDMVFEVARNSATPAMAASSQQSPVKFCKNSDLQSLQCVCIMYVYCILYTNSHEGRCPFFISNASRMLPTEQVILSSTSQGYVDFALPA